VNHPLSAGLIDENKIVKIVLDFPLKYIQDSLKGQSQEKVGKMSV
jgi:hypothetical protein